MRRSVRDTFVPALLAVVSAAFGCGSDGAPPPPGRIYFPIALEVSDDFDGDGFGDFLVVANSNFDLRYNSGSLQAYDLDRISDELEINCGTLSVDERSECGIIALEDDREDLADSITPVAGLIESEVLIGSFADGLGIAPSGGGSRLYLPVRSEGDLSYVDMSPAGILSCGAMEDSTNLTDGDRHECTDTFRGAEAGAAREDGLLVPPDPVSLVVGARVDRIPSLEEGNYVVMAHRGGRMSLFWETADGVRPELVDTLEGLPNELVEFAADPVDGSLWVATAFDPVIPRVGIALGQSAENSFLFRASDLAVTGIDTGGGGLGDTRVVRFDPRPDVRRAYVLSRRPRAVLSVDVDGSVGALDVRAQIPVGFGPSRMEVAHFSRTGHTLAFVTNFDSRDLFVIDLDAERLVGIVRSLGGPFELAVDVEREKVYVGDFRSSVLRVLELRPMFECLTDMEVSGEDADGEECSPVPLGFVGRPRAVQELI